MGQQAQGWVSLPSLSLQTVWTALTKATLLRQLRALIARRHLERKMEARQILARMVIREGELRNAEIVRPRLSTFIDAGIEVDIVHPRRAGRLHEDLDVALAVEGA